MIVKLKKRTEPLKNKAGGYEIIFWDNKKDDSVLNYYMPKNTLGFVSDQGKTNGKRHLTFYFLDQNMKEKSIEFIGWKHFNEYVEPIIRKIK